MIAFLSLLSILGFAGPDETELEREPSLQESPFLPQKFVAITDSIALSTIGDFLLVREIEPTHLEDAEADAEDDLDAGELEWVMKPAKFVILIPDLDRYSKILGFAQADPFSKSAVYVLQTHSAGQPLKKPQVIRLTLDTKSKNVPDRIVRTNRERKTAGLIEFGRETDPRDVEIISIDPSGSLIVARHDRGEIHSIGLLPGEEPSDPNRYLIGRGHKLADIELAPHQEPIGLLSKPFTERKVVGIRDRLRREDLDLEALLRNKEGGLSTLHIGTPDSDPYPRDLGFIIEAVEGGHLPLRPIETGLQAVHARLCQERLELRP